MSIDADFSLWTSVVLSDDCLLFCSLFDNSFYLSREFFLLCTCSHFIIYYCARLSICHWHFFWRLSHVCQAKFTTRGRCMFKCHFIIISVFKRTWRFVYCFSVNKIESDLCDERFSFIQYFGSRTGHCFSNLNQAKNKNLFIFHHFEIKHK